MTKRELRRQNELLRQHIVFLRAEVMRLERKLSDEYARQASL